MTIRHKAHAMQALFQFKKFNINKIDNKLSLIYYHLVIDRSSNSNYIFITTTQISKNDCNFPLLPTLNAAQKDSFKL